MFPKIRNNKSLNAVLIRTQTIASLIALIVIAAPAIGDVTSSHSTQIVFSEPEHDTAQTLDAWIKTTYVPTMDESHYALRSRVVAFDPAKLSLMFESSYDRSDRFSKDRWGRLETTQNFSADSSDLEFYLFPDEKIRVSVVRISVGRHTNMAMISAVAIGDGFTGRENIRFELMPNGELRGSIIVAGKLFRISGTPTPNTAVITEMDLDGVLKPFRVD